MARKVHVQPGRKAADERSRKAAERATRPADGSEAENAPDTPAK